jgi:hypothetical protein
MKRKNLLEAVRGMEKLAAQCLERHDQERARSIIQVCKPTCTYLIDEFKSEIEA